MDDLAFLRERIESYADYTNDDRRRLVDEQVRAYVGEALARVLERLRPAGPAGEALARVILRCQFADQAVVRALDLEEPSPAEIAAIHSADRELVALADRADTVDAAGLEEYVAQLDAALDRRSRIVTGGGAATATIPPPR
jgi:hypothetical protein